MKKEYRVLTGGGKLSNVLDGIRKAAELEIPVKINAVLREQTDVCALAAFAEQNHVTLRFIEMNAELVLERFCRSIQKAKYWKLCRSDMAGMRGSCKEKEKQILRKNMDMVRRYTIAFRI